MSDKNDLLLIVEDNEDDVFALRWALKKAGIANPAHVATDGKQAIEYLSDAACKTPCMIFLDLKLPYVNGLEVLEWVREQTDLKALAVVILTGSDEARDHQRADALNASFYIVKPAMPEDIRRIMEALPTSEWSECEMAED